MPRRRNKKSKKNDDSKSRAKITDTNAFSLLMDDNDVSDNNNSDNNNNTNTHKERTKKKRGNLFKKHERINNEEKEKIINENNQSGDVYIPPIISNDWVTSSGNKKKRNKYKNHNDKKYVGENLEYYDPSKESKGDNMKLNSNWEVWMHSNDNEDWSLKSYNSIFNIDSIGSMWRFLGCMRCLNKDIAQYYIMREGITPIWEDNHNKNGAICSIMIENTNRFNRHFRGDLGVDVFSAICILVMNESFVRNNCDINGLNYSIKNRNILIKLWIKDYNNNKNFVQNLPITLLSLLDDIISNMESKNNVMKYQGKSSVSVRLNKIEPNY